MLLNLKEILQISNDKKIAVGSFNTPNMTSVKAVISAAEELNQPVIIMHAQIHEEMGICKIDEIAPIMLMMAEKAKVPVCVHLDHGTDIGYVKKALENGFTSVMFDGSMMSKEENFVYTRLVVELAKPYGASVEGEIGSMGAREGGGAGGKSVYTEPTLAKQFAEITQIDALACAFGTAHGIYTTTPKLDFERVSKIKSLTNVPLVMHGGSGIKDEDYREVIRRGISKVNYYTYMAKAGADVVSQKEYTQFHDIVIDAEKAMRENVKKAIRVFSSLN